MRKFLGTTKPVIHFTAAICLLFAGAIHSFPVLLAKWEDLIIIYPWAHPMIGFFGFFVGILNLLILFGSYRSMITK